MKNIVFLASFVVATCLFAAAPEHPNLKPFPQAGEGQVRHVIVVPEQAEEQDFKVEVFVGKTVMTDPVNRKMLGGKWEEVTLQGWGYTYYEVSVGEMASTMMAPMPGTADVERFVSLPGKMLRYNSRMPIVIYTPPGVEVQYRIWTAGEMKALGK
jgi:ecotin